MDGYTDLSYSGCFFSNFSGMVYNLSHGQISFINFCTDATVSCDSGNRFMFFRRSKSEFHYMRNIYFLVPYENIHLFLLGRMNSKHHMEFKFLDILTLNE